jgi:DNA helicase-2/ATP-dependent DNA helicase PcrA
LEDVALVADIDNYDEQADAAALMTLHSAKGLEFKTVFMIGFEENLFPCFRSIDSGSAAQMAEERRLCYVGFTRARETLFITNAFGRMQYGGFIKNKPSRFLDNVPPDCITSVNMYGKERTTGPGRMGEQFAQRTTSPFAPQAINHPQSGLPPELAALAKPASNPLSKLAAAKSNMRREFPPAPRPIPTKAPPPNFTVGDNVNQAKFGTGKVLAINPAGADYEVTVQFPSHGTKKFMASLARLVKK